MGTHFTNLGYTPLSIFEVRHGSGELKVGDVVKLLEDDGSTVVEYQTIDGSRSGWLITTEDVVLLEQHEGLAYYRELFPSGTKFKVITKKSGAWAKVGEEYTVGDVIENCEDGIVIRTQEDLSRGVKDAWVIASRCKPIREETPNIETSDELQFKVVCNQTYILTIKGVTFELTEDEFNELERVMGDF